MESKPYVSVIIPVYNAQAYLEQCLQSLENQSMKDFEVICIDDGSTDASVEIIHEFMRRDERFSLIHQKNQYAGVARNNGLQHARGEYLLFLDADDFFHEELLAHTYQQAKKTQADIVLYGAKTYDMAQDAMIESPYLFRKALLPEKEVFSHRDVPDFYLQITNSCPWLQLYRRQFILDEGIQFQGLPNTNDAFFVITALSCAKRVTTVKEDLVYYRINSGASTQDRKYRNPTCFMTAYMAIYEELNHRGIYCALERSFVSKAVMSCAHHLKSTTDLAAIREIRKAICSKAFIDTGILNHPSDYYFDPEKAKSVLAVPEIVRTEQRYHAEEVLFRRTKNIQEKDDIAVTVIVPVIDRTPYLGELLSCLDKQTLKNIEVLSVVADGFEEENCLVQELTSCDCQVWRCEACNVSQARNEGLKSARGEYVYFCNGNDLLSEDALERIYRFAKAQNLSIACFDGEVLTKHGKRVAHSSLSVKHRYEEVYRGTALLRIMVRDRETVPELNRMLISKTFIKETGMDFDERILFAGYSVFGIRSMLSAKRVSCLHNRFLFKRGFNEWEIEPCFGRAEGYFRAYKSMIAYLKENPVAQMDENEINEIIRRLLWRAQDEFAKLDEQKAYAFTMMEANERAAFEAEVCEVARLKQERAAWMKSVFYQIYRIEVAAKRRIPQAYHYVQEYGMNYVIKRVARKIRMKLKG